MSENIAVKEFVAANEFQNVPLPDAERRILIARLSGTFVGTVKLQTSDDGKTWSDGTVVAVASSGATGGNPTAVGVYAALLGASAKYGRVLCSAYTSGTIRAEAMTIRASS